MIGRRELPPRFVDFNRQWGAPRGFTDTAPRFAALDRLGARLKSRQIQAKARGPFGFQPDNNATRVVEYPWAFHAVPVLEGQTVIDLGGSLSGLQFALAKSGAKVINVDPSTAASMGWEVDEPTLALLNRAFGTNVELRKSFLEEAGFADASVDTIYCISTIEHIPAEQLPALAREIGRILKPGGAAVLTIDLFFDLKPFTARSHNIHGSNIDVCQLVRDSGLVLAQGARAELLGYPEFDPALVLSNASDYCQGDIALNAAQLLVLRKPTDS